MKLVMVFIMSVLCFAVQAQTANPQTDTLRWNATGFTDLNTNDASEKACQFITYGNSKIDWVQKAGKLIYTLSVSGMDETWSDANADGSVTYNVSLNNLTGTLIIARSSGIISLTLNITGDSDKINNRYSIINFDKL